jgi:hypothetical protein
LSKKLEILELFLEECKIHMKSKLDIKYIIKINNGVRFGQKRTNKKEPTPTEKNRHQLTTPIEN